LTPVHEIEAAHRDQSHLRDPDKFHKALISNVSSSTAVETGASVEAIARALIETREVKLVKKPQRCAR
jgi:hypothetical protein